MVSKAKYKKNVREKRPGEMTYTDARACAIRSLQSGPPIWVPIRDIAIEVRWPKDHPTKAGKLAWKEHMDFGWPSKRLGILLIPDIGSTPSQLKRGVGNRNFAMKLRRLASIGWMVYAYTYQETRYTIPFERHIMELQECLGIDRDESPPLLGPTLVVNPEDPITLPRGFQDDHSHIDPGGPVGDSPG